MNLKTIPGHKKYLKENKTVANSGIAKIVILSTRLPMTNVIYWVISVKYS